MNISPNPHASSRTPKQPIATTASVRPAVHIDIQKLSLHGFSPSEQMRFQRALSSALQQQASALQDWSTLTSRTLRSLPTMQAKAGRTPEKSAQLLASELFSRLAANHAGHGHG